MSSNRPLLERPLVGKVRVTPTTAQLARERGYTSWTDGSGSAWLESWTGALAHAEAIDRYSAEPVLTRERWASVWNLASVDLEWREATDTLVKLSGGIEERTKTMLAWVNALLRRDLGVEIPVPHYLIA